MDPSDAAIFLYPSSRVSWAPSRQRRNVGKNGKSQPRNCARNRNTPLTSAFRETRRTSQKKKSTLKENRKAGEAELASHLSYGGGLNRTDYTGWERIHGIPSGRGRLWHSMWDDTLGWVDQEIGDLEADVRKEWRVEERAEVEHYEQLWNSGEGTFRWTPTEEDGCPAFGPVEECRYALAVCSSLVRTGLAASSDPVLGGVAHLPEDLMRKVADFAFEGRTTFAPGVYLCSAKMALRCPCCYRYSQCTLVLLPDATARFDVWNDGLSEAAEWNNGGEQERVGLEEFLYEWEDRHIIDYAARFGCAGVEKTSSTTATFHVDGRSAVCTARRAPNDGMVSEWVIDLWGIMGISSRKCCARFHLVREL